MDNKEDMQRKPSNAKGAVKKMGSRKEQRALIITITRI